VYEEPAALASIRNNTVLRSVNGPHGTIINGRGMMRVLWITNENWRIEGFTITNGNVNGNGAGLFSNRTGLVISNCIFVGNVTVGNNRRGAGIRAENAPHIIDTVIRGNRHSGTGGYGGGGSLNGGSLVRCIISANEADHRGGGVYAEGTPLIHECHFYDNVQSPNTASGNGGGALYFAGAGTASACTFNNNKAEAQGGAVYVNNVAARITGCAFTGNRTMAAGANFGGGAIFAGNSASVRDSTFARNISLNDGGGVLLNNGSALVNCIFENNSAADWGGGAAIYTRGAITNCLFYNNTADEGGAIYAHSTTRADVHSCTLVNNTALTGAGAIDCYQNTYVRNTIAYGNSAPLYTNYRNQSATVRWYYSCTWPALGSPYDAGGNITNQPLFLDAAGASYHPATNSPVVDAGTNEAWMATAQELTPQARIVGSVVDIGAYELGRLVCVFKGSPRAGAAPLTVNFTSYVTGTNTAGLHYYWDFNAPYGHATNGLGLSAPAWTYTNDGVFGVSLTVSNAAGEHAACSQPDYIYVVSTPRYVATNGPHIAPFISWETAASNIEAAVAISYDYMYVYVSGGTYRVSRPILLTNAIRLISVSGPEQTIIDGMSTSRCVHITADACVEGFTLSNGVALGGGMSGYGGNALLHGAGSLSNCHLYDGRAVYGGGAALYNGGLVYAALFASNTARYGGGAYLFGPSRLQNAVLRRNYASDRGGGALGDAASVIRNCLVHENAAATNGGGISIQNSAVRAESCTVSSNHAYQGGGVHSRSGGAYYNTISYFNTAAVAANSNWYSEVVGTDYGRSFSHCNTAPLAGLPNQTGCISDDPRFRNAAAWDFRLHGNSACINTGVYQTWMASAVDLDGTPRVREERVDIGAYESLMAFLRITNTTEGSRLPFAQLHHVMAGESGGLVGMLWYTNRWSADAVSGELIGAVPTGAVWNVQLHLPHYGRYEFAIYGTNQYGDMVGDGVSIERARHKIHFIRRR